MKIDIAVETETSSSTRARQVSAMFDCPVTEKMPSRVEPWNVGLVVGPSGSGKTTVMRHVWGEPPTLKWGGASVVDDFDPKLSMGRSPRPAARSGSIRSLRGCARSECSRTASSSRRPRASALRARRSDRGRRVYQCGRSSGGSDRIACCSKLVRKQGGSSWRSGVTTTSSTGFSPTGFSTWRRGPSPGGYFSGAPLECTIGRIPPPRGVSSLRITT